MAVFFTPVRPADFSEIRKHAFTVSGTVPEALYREGVFMKIDTTTGLLMPVYRTGNRTDNTLLNAVTTLYGVMVGSSQELEDPVLSSRMDYAGQTPTRRVSVANCIPHREVVVQPINGSGDKDPTIAVPSNIGKPVQFYAQNYPIVVDGTTYWIYAGAILTDQAHAEGYIVGVTTDKNLIVRIVRGKWIELA